MPELESDAQRLERIQRQAGWLSHADMDWLLAQAVQAQELRAALEGMIRYFNQYSSGDCEGCWIPINPHRPNCEMEAARRVLAAQAGSSSHGPSTDA